MSKLTGVIFIFVFGFSALSQAAGEQPTKATGTPVNTLTAEQKLSDLDQLVALIKSGYGPRLYKKDKLKIDVDVLRADYATKITSSKSNAEFYYDIMRFIAEFHDGHFRATLPSEMLASLPLSTDLVEGKVLIDTVNRQLLPQATFPYDKGDEVVTFDGRPVADVLNELKAYRGLGFSQSELRYAALALTVRTGTRMPVPSGDVKLTIRRGLSTVVDTVTLTWKVTGKSIDEALSSVKPIFSMSPNDEVRNFDDLSNFSLWTDVANPQLENSYRCSGTTRIEIPKDATMILTTPFVAYYFPTAKGNVGYLRIPHYSPEDGNFELRFHVYEYAISILEKNTVGLIIDQDHNCGGSVDYLHNIVSLFVSNFKPMQFQLLANKEELISFSAWMKEAGENTLAYLSLTKVRDLIQAAWMRGDYMTTLISLDGRDTLPGNAVQYSKPVVMLIDEMSGSGGDAFPSLMQGLGRAKLIGTRTMGLGGHVVAQPALFYSRITPEMTKSLFYRPDGVAVENNGAVPDFAYPITRDDFMYGYRAYRDFATGKLLDLVQAPITPVKP